MNEEVFQAVNDVFARGESAALVTIIRTQGSTPQRVGAKMLGLPRRAHRGHHRRRVLRERRLLEGAPRARNAQAARRPVRARGRPRRGVGPHLRGPDGSLRRTARGLASTCTWWAPGTWRCTSDSWPRRPASACTSSTTGEVLQRRAVPGRRRSRGGRHPGVAGEDGFSSHRLRRDPDARPPPRLDALRALAPRPLRYLGLIGSKRRSRGCTKPSGKPAWRSPIRNGCTRRSAWTSAR